MTFPPGRAKLATKPEPTGSPAFAITMGMVVVAFFAARAGVPCNHDQINIETNQVRRKLRERSALALQIGTRWRYYFPQSIQACQLLPKRFHEDRDTRSSAIIQETYAGDFACLLRVDGRAKRKEHSARARTMILFFMSFFLSNRH